MTSLVPANESTCRMSTGLSNIGVSVPSVSPVAPVVFLFLFFKMSIMDKKIMLYKALITMPTKLKFLRRKGWLTLQQLE